MNRRLNPDQCFEKILQLGDQRLDSVATGLNTRFQCDMYSVGVKCYVDRGGRWGGGRGGGEGGVRSQTMS